MPDPKPLFHIRLTTPMQRALGTNQPFAYCRLFEGPNDDAPDATYGKSLVLQGRDRTTTVAVDLRGGSVRSSDYVRRPGFRATKHISTDWVARVIGTQPLADPGTASTDELCRVLIIYEFSADPTAVAVEDSHPGAQLLNDARPAFEALGGKLAVAR